MRAIETTIQDLHNVNKFHSYRFFYNSDNEIVECQYCQTIGQLNNNDYIVKESYDSGMREFDLASPIYPQYFEKALQFVNECLKNPITL